MTASPDFDSIKQQGIYGEEFWSARDLGPLLGYTQWRRFEDAIKRAKTSCETNGDRVEDHFADIGKMVTLGSGAQREVDDYALTRYACYLIAQNGDPRKPEIAAAQAYFLIMTRTQEMHQLREEQQKRLGTRRKVSESFKQLAGAAMESGVQSENMDIFMNAGYLGLHRHTVEALKTRKGIPPKEDYLDNITREELSAIDFKNVQTEGRLRRDGTTQEQEAIETHYFVGDQVRKSIEAIHGPLPEDLPRAPSIKAEIERQNRKARQVRKKKEDQEDDGQQRLL